MAQAQAGDRQAFGKVVEHYRERLYCAALGIVRNHEDARELSQEAFVRAFKNLRRFDTRRPFYPWLYRILRNLSLDHIQKYGSHRETSLDYLTEEKHVQFEDGGGFASVGGGSGDEDVRDKIHREQMLAHMRAAIEELKDEFREIILMKHIQEMSYKEIAEALDIPMGTVMSRLFHARKALATKLEKYRP